MCGIVGTVNHTFDESILDLIAHRGPDDRGIERLKIDEDEITFGHVRLSIQDLSDAGHQPMYSTDKDYLLIFNGEVYNHLELREKLPKTIFKGHSDTETILHYLAKFGVESVKDFNGIFAFAFLDIKEKKLYLARDRFGVKPLYYHQKKEQLFFSSEIKPILKMGEDFGLDMEAVNEYFTLRYNPSPKTSIKGIQKLYPGEVLSYDLERHKLIKVCNINEELIPNIQIDKHKSEAYWVSALSETLEAAVERQMLGDVEIGSFLSGGLDSALITAIASKYTKNTLKTFCIGFEGSEAFDESTAARRSAELLGTEHFDIIANASDYMQNLQEATFMNEEPNGTENTFAQYEISELASKHTKVVLAGQGADEIFMGYGKYKAELERDKYLPYLKMAKPFSGLLLSPKLHKVKRALYALTEEDELKRFEKIYTVFTNRERQHLLESNFADEGTSLDYFFSLIPTELNTLDKIALLDTYTSLSDELLMYGDKMTMATSVEMRVPFLDNEVVALAQRIPNHYKIKNGVHKYILKEVAKQYLPDEIIHRPKKGFDMPSLAWFQNDLNDEIMEFLTSEEAFIPHHIPKNELKKIVLNYKQHKEFDVRKLYLLMGIEHLLQLLQRRV
jgi:asparagine synthase (glutamine-hydrolysing)